MREIKQDFSFTCSKSQKKEYCIKPCQISLQAPMALFYPATFGIVGQKMTILQHRSQGDPEDPHDEHYLLATQSKQEQVCD